MSVLVCLSPGIAAKPLVGPSGGAEVEAELGRMRELSPLGVALTPQVGCSLPGWLKRCGDGHVSPCNLGWGAGAPLPQPG